MIVSYQAVDQYLQRSLVTDLLLKVAMLHWNGGTTFKVDHSASLSLEILLHSSY